MPNIALLVDWYFYGFIRYVIYWIPLLTPPSVNRAMPWQWLKYSSIWTWLQKGANKGGPTEAWLQDWFRMAFGESLLLTEFVAQPYVDRVKATLLAVIGIVSSNFGSLSRWIGQIQDWLGLPLPWWSSTVHDGLSWLRAKLPQGIRDAWQTWDAIFDGIADGVRAWVRGVYDHFRKLASDAWNWAFNQGEMLLRWYNHVRGWIDAFRSDPYGTIAGLLGSAWWWLLDFRNRGRAYILYWLGPDIYKALTFARDCSTFYYNLWARGWRVLSDLIDDPVDYLYTRIEQMFVDRW